MDPASTPGHLDRRTAALNGVCLERTVELDNVRLRLRDWPGSAGPIVHIADPLRHSSLVERLAASVAPRARVLSATPREDQPYQVLVADLHGVCAQFGLVNLVVVAEGLSCSSALLLAAWYPDRVRALVLVDERAPEGDALLARSLRDCPPDRPTLGCSVLQASATGTSLLVQVEALLD